MKAVTEDLASAVKWLDDAEQQARNASTVLERVSDSLADEAHAAAKLLDDTLARSRKALDALERA